MNYKITFPTGWTTVNEQDENLDINVILENGSVYWGTLFTMRNIEYLMEKDGKSFFWSVNMAIASDLSYKGINDVVSNIIDSGAIEEIFSDIGTIEEQYPGLTSQDIIHMEMGCNLL